MRQRIGPGAATLVRIAIAGSLLGLLWHAADGPAAARSLAEADWKFLLLAVAALTLQTILSAIRWRLTAGQLGLTFGVLHAVREYYFAQAINQSLPGGMIGDASRAYRSRKQAGLMVAGQAVILERLAGQIAMLLVLVAGFLCTTVAAGGLEWPRWLALPLMGVTLAGLAAPLLLWAARRLSGAIGRSARRLGDLLVITLVHPRVLPAQVVLSIGTVSCNLAAFGCCVRAVGGDLSLAALVVLVPVILFAMLVPVSISGWGFREGAAAALFPLAGAPASDGLASSVAFGLTFLVAALPGVILARWERGAPATCRS